MRRTATFAILLFGFVTSVRPFVQRGVNATVKADGIVVEKASRTMMLMGNGKVLKIYKVALSTAPILPKEREADHKVPEGQYIFAPRLVNVFGNVATVGMHTLL